MILLQMNRTDISKALVNLQSEYQRKGSLFSLRAFTLKHQLPTEFAKALFRLELIKYEGNIVSIPEMITPELISTVFRTIEILKNESIERDKKPYKKNVLRRVIKELNPKAEDVYISINIFQDNSHIPQQVLDKAIGIGNGMFLINVKHFEGYKIEKRDTVKDN